MNRGSLVGAALAVAFGFAAVAHAQSDNVPLPVPRPSPTDAPPEDPLLRGANSPLAAPALVGEGGPGVDQTVVEIGNQPLPGEGMPQPTGTPGAELAAPGLDVGPPADVRPGTYTLEARLTADGPPLQAGVKWRIFGDLPGPNGRLPLFGEAEGGIIYLRLEPGTYFVHAAFGRAGATRRLDVSGPTGGEVVVLDAGGVRLLAINGTEEVLPTGEATFDIYAHDEGGSDERHLLVADAPPGRIIGLNAGVYRVVSRYGEANAIVRADIRVDAGKLTEASIYQKAARLTLKLVEEHGGEALANTAWSVLTPAGESVMESVGAFPSVVLSAGEYTAIARHNDRAYTATFAVETGVHRDVEVLLK